MRVQISATSNWDFDKTTIIEVNSIDEAIKRLKGIDCRGRGTSCPDQLAIALEQIKEKTA